MTAISSDDLKERLKRFALRAMRLGRVCKGLLRPVLPSGRVLRHGVKSAPAQTAPPSQRPLTAICKHDLVDALPRTPTADVLGRQIVRSATSVGANYRSACRARSRADFVSKLGIVEEEADECVYWLELIVDAELIRRERAADLMQEACEITAIVVSSIKEARSHVQRLPSRTIPPASPI